MVVFIFLHNSYSADLLTKLNEKYKKKKNPESQANMELNRNELDGLASLWSSTLQCWKFWNPQGFKKNGMDI